MSLGSDWRRERVRGGKKEVRKPSVAALKALSHFSSSSELSRRGLLLLKGCGRKTLREIEWFMEGMGLEFAPDPPQQVITEEDRLLAFLERRPEG